MKTETQPKSKSDLKREQIGKDRKRAEQLSEAYAMLVEDYNAIANEQSDKLTPIIDEMNRKMEPVKEIYRPRLEAAHASLEAAAAELLEIGNRQRKTLFDVKGNWHFENGYYLHAKGKTEVITGPAFDLSKFVKKFAKYVDVKFKIGALVKLFTDADNRKKSGIEKYDLDLKTEETLEIKQKSQSKNEQEEQG